MQTQYYNTNNVPQEKFFKPEVDTLTIYQKKLNNYLSEGDLDKEKQLISEIIHIRIKSKGDNWIKLARAATKYYDSDEPIHQWITLFCIRQLSYGDMPWSAYTSGLPIEQYTLQCMALKNPLYCMELMNGRLHGKVDNQTQRVTEENIRQNPDFKEFIDALNQCKRRSPVQFLERFFQKIANSWEAICNAIIGKTSQNTNENRSNMENK